jgi:hypothetical protein
MSQDERDETVAFRWVAHSLIRQLDLREDCMPELLRELNRERTLVCRYLLERPSLPRAEAPKTDLARRA